MKPADITRFREERGITKRKLASMLRVSADTISNYESGNARNGIPHVVALALAALAFGLPPYGGEDADKA